METYFITLNWNTAGLLAGMVESVEATTPGRHTWVILDNGSTDEDLRILYDYILNRFQNVVIAGMGLVGRGDPREEWCINTWGQVATPESVDVVVLNSPDNLGCILGHNACFDTAAMLAQGKPHRIVMLDTDVTVQEAGWLERVDAWAGPRVGIVGLEHNAESVCCGAVFLDTNGNWYIHGGQTDRAEPVEGESVGLGFAVVRWPVLEAGLRFDTGFKMYYKQDDALCFQVRAQLGLEVWAYPVGNTHTGSRSIVANEYRCGDAGCYNEFDQMKQDNQAYFVEQWRWALRDRRLNLAGEAVHLDEMREVLAQGKE